MNKDYIVRDIQDLLLEASHYFSVICITGPRQSGKSTILKKMFPKAVVYTGDFENNTGDSEIINYKSLTLYISFHTTKKSDNNP